MAEAVLAEFAEPRALAAAIRELRAHGPWHLETFTPYPVSDVQQALDLSRSRAPVHVLVVGLAGAASAFLLQFWMNGVDYPLNVGGRPLFSAPSFVPITFELGVLAASLTAFVAFLRSTRLPQPWHPLFEVPGFERSSVDRFFLAVRGEGADLRRLRALLLRHGALRVLPVEVGP